MLKNICIKPKLRILYNENKNLNVKINRDTIYYVVYLLLVLKIRE